MQAAYLILVTVIPATAAATDLSLLRSSMSDGWDDEYWRTFLFFLLTCLLPDTILPTYKAPAHTGSDYLSKLIFNDDFVNDIIINTLLDVPGNNSYRVGSNEWPDGSRSDFMTRATQYCVQAHKRSRRLPVIIISTPWPPRPSCISQQCADMCSIHPIGQQRYMINNPSI